MVLEISITLFGKLNVFLNHNENQIAIREREKIHYAILIGRKLSEKKTVLIYTLSLTCPVLIKKKEIDSLLKPARRILH